MVSMNFALSQVYRRYFADLLLFLVVHWVFVLSSVSRSVGTSEEILALFVDILHNKRLQDMATFMDKVKLFYKVKANVCLTSIR